MDNPMYCHDCDKVVDADQVCVFLGTYIDPPEYEDECPICKSRDLTEASQCHSCGEWFEFDTMTKIGKHWFCQECKENK